LEQSLPELPKALPRPKRFLSVSACACAASAQEKDKCLKEQWLEEKGLTYITKNYRLCPMDGVEAETQETVAES